MTLYSVEMFYQSYPVDGRGFMAQDLCIQNTAGPEKRQDRRVSRHPLCIFGSGISIFAKLRHVTAQSREEDTATSGFSFQKCNISASYDLTPIKGIVKTFLGRPWRAFSRVVFMESFIDDVIDPAGWTPWNITDIGTLSTLYYGEYRNTGPGADTSKRVGWKGYHTLTPNETASFTVENLLQGHLWINASIVPFELGL
ncbi:putative hydrolase [Arabidopsis thaliana]